MILSFLRFAKLAWHHDRFGQRTLDVREPGQLPVASKRLLLTWMKPIEKCLGSSVLISFDPSPAR